MFGRQNEKKAIERYEQATGKEVLSCGLFIDIENPFLGASPDGLIGQDGIIEVKTLPSIKTQTIEETLNRKQNICLERKNNVVQLKRKHNYYYQVTFYFKMAIRY